MKDSYNGSNGFFIVATKPPSTGSISGIGSPTSYNTEVVGMLNYAIAVGAPVLNRPPGRRCALPAPPPPDPARLPPGGPAAPESWSTPHP